MIVKVSKEELEKRLREREKMESTLTPEQLKSLKALRQKQPTPEQIKRWQTEDADNI